MDSPPTHTHTHTPHPGPARPGPAPKGLFCPVHTSQAYIAFRYRWYITTHSGSWLTHFIYTNSVFFYHLNFLGRYLSIDIHGLPGPPPPAPPPAQGLCCAVHTLSCIISLHINLFHYLRLCVLFKIRLSTQENLLKLLYYLILLPHYPACPTPLNAHPKKHIVIFLFF